MNWKSYSCKAIAKKTEVDDGSGERTLKELGGGSVFGLRGKDKRLRIVQGDRWRNGSSGGY